MAISLGVVGAVADDELITDRETDKIDRDSNLSSLRLVEQRACPETADPALTQLGGGISDRPASIDDVVDQQHRPPSEAGRYLAVEMHRTAGLFRRAVAAQPHEFDLGASAGAVQRAGEVGDKHHRTLEYANDDEIGRESAGDLRRERLDPGGDLRCAEQNAYLTHRYFAVIYQKKAGTEVATRIAPERASKPRTMRRKPASVKLR